MSLWLLYTMWSPFIRIVAKSHAPTLQIGNMTVSEVVALMGNNS